MIRLYKKLTILLLILLSCSQEKESGVVFRAIVGGDPPSLDTQLSTDTTSHQIIVNTFQGIVNYDTKNSSYKEGLAKSWDISKDNREFTFHLRDNLKWSDGEEITAAEIKASFLRILDPQTGAIYANMVAKTILNGEKLYEGIVSKEELGIEVIDKKTIKFKLENSKPYFLSLLTHTAFIPVPVHVIEKYGSKWTDTKNYVTNGAYKIKERKIKDKIVLEKNPYYWNTDNVALDHVILYSVTDDLTAYNMYINNEIDYLHAISSERIQELEMRDDFFIFNANGVYSYAFNLENATLKNKNVRKALTLAINREVLTKEVLKGTAEPTRNISPKFSNYSYGRELALFDPEEARKALAEAGYPNGDGFPKITLKYVTSDVAKKLNEFIQSQWKENLNIEVALANEEWGTFLANKNQFQYDIAQSGWLGDYVDPMTFFEVLESKFNMLNYRNKEYDLLLEQTEKSTAPSQRQELFRKAERLVVEEDFPIIPLYYPKHKSLFRVDKWSGFNTNLNNIVLFEDFKVKD